MDFLDKFNNVVRADIARGNSEEEKRETGQVYKTALPDINSKHIKHFRVKQLVPS